jgi:hypothetical protein
MKTGNGAFIAAVGGLDFDSIAAALAPTPAAPLLQEAVAAPVDERNKTTQCRSCEYSNLTVDFGPKCPECGSQDLEKWQFLPTEALENLLFRATAAHEGPYSVEILGNRTRWFKTNGGRNILRQLLSEFELNDLKVEYAQRHRATDAYLAAADPQTITSLVQEVLAARAALAASSAGGGVPQSIQQVLEKWAGVRPGELGDDAVPLFLEELKLAGLQLAPVLQPAEQAAAALAGFVQQAYAYKSTFPGLPEGYTHDDIDKLFEWADGADDLLRTAPALLTAAEPAALPLLVEGAAAGPQWVSVKERLPAEQGRVLVCQLDDDGPQVFTARFTPEWHYDAENGGGQAGSHPAKFHDCRQSKITHWQPLPAAPADALR